MLKVHHGQPDISFDMMVVHKMNRAIAHDYVPKARPMTDLVKGPEDVAAFTVFAQPDRIYNRGNKYKINSTTQNKKEKKSYSLFIAVVLRFCYHSHAAPHTRPRMFFRWSQRLSQNVCLRKRRRARSLDDFGKHATASLP